MAILAAFIVMVAGWMFWMPRDPVRLYRAIPADALAVGSHERIGEHLRSFAGNPLLANAAAGLDIGGEERSGLFESPRVHKWMDRAGSRETVVSYVPSIGGGEPAWIAAVWIGNLSHYLRWMLFFGQLPRFSALDSYAGWRIWGLNEPLTDTGMRLSIAAGQGILFACVSRQPAGVLHALAAFEGLAPSVSSHDRFSHLTETFTAETGWILSDGFMTSYRMHEVSPERLSAELILHTSIPPQPSLDEASDLLVPGRLLGGLPAILAAFPSPLARELLSSPQSPAWAQIAAGLLGSGDFFPDNNVVLLSVLTGKYGGGMGKEPFRMRVPAAVLMLRAAPDDPSIPARRLLAELNKRYRLGLVALPEPGMPGGRRLWTVREAGDNLLSNLEPEDMPAFAVHGEWLILCSNTRSLERLLERLQDAETDVRRGDWLAALDEDPAAALFWMNMDAGGKALQLPLALWSMQFRHDKNAAPPPFLAHARAWIRTAAPAQTLILRMKPGTDKPVVSLSIGTRNNQTGTSR